MAESILFGLAQEILTKLGATALNEIASAWGFKAELDKLNATITTMKNVLLDAEDRQADDHAVRGWLERLTYVVYAADDLFDELNTIASRRQLMGTGNSISMKVRAFFSHSNHIGLAFNVSRKIREIRKQIEAIAKDGELFQFVQSNTHEGGKSVKRIRRDQTYSFVEVIGRDADKNAILDLLFASSSKIEPGNEVLPVPVISIVGIGGQGKTTLAHLAYSDPQVEESFDLRLWVSEVLDFDGVVEKILRFATKAETPKLDMLHLQAMLQEAISDKKYLLVMDDVWDENRDKWVQLRGLLKMGGEGSKILVTTRSKKVARIMESLAMYELQGLTNEKSWELFVKVAFEPGQAQQQPRLVELGKKIVKKCANVPLAIRTLGSLLYGEEERKWSLLMNTSLAKLSDGNQGVNDIISILKLSYNDLWSPLKNCFAYCALFSKDYEFDKEKLKQLWMAEGYIVADDEGNQSLEDVAEDYFQFLLQRCFFQDIKTNKWGAIIGCKMHDLIHDLAQSVARAKCKVASLEETNFDGKIIHFSYACRLTSSWKIQDSMRNMKLLRTFLMPEQKFDGSLLGKLVCKQLISSFSCLRVLDLHNLGLETLPDSIGHLIHLRYLNLSETPIKQLPNSITKLLNLQTLNLYKCWNLQVLPTGITKLENLRSLDVGDCGSLLEMPQGIGKLTLLQKLPLFKASYKKSHQAKLSELKQLNNLRGELCIDIKTNIRNPSFEATEANLISKQGLDILRIHFMYDLEECQSDDHEVVLEGLKPHSSLRKLEIYWYYGKKFPSWATMSISLPNLVYINLWKGQPSEVPVLSQLRFLKYLYLGKYNHVKYMENGNMRNQFSSSSSLLTYTETIFFPSLEELEMTCMDSLKGWWKEDDEANLQQGNGLSMLSFSKLSKLTITRCRKLITFPLCPNVEELNVCDTNESLLSLLLKIATTASNSSSQTTSRLKKLNLSNVEPLISLPMHCLPQLSSLSITGDDQLKSTDTIVEAFARLSSSLRNLEFNSCHNLRSISKGLGHLTALETLKLTYCDQLDLSLDQQEANEEDEDENDMPWKAFETNLRSLVLLDLDKLVDFPSGFRHLTNLRSLEILNNYELRELPEWISCLSSLVNLILHFCPKLTCLPDGFRNLTNLNTLRISRCSPILMERCEGPNGSDRLKIQHIPFVFICKW
ncbi:unnamed protein product [Amaranthus hypochondriacus]